MPNHKQIRHINKGHNRVKCAISSDRSDSSSHATVSEESASLKAAYESRSSERYPAGTRVKKYFNGHGWCPGTVVSASGGKYKAHFEQPCTPSAPRKDYEFSASQMPRLTKTANVTSGTRLDIYWPHRKCYCPATVQTERPRKRENYLICYDGKADREWIDLHHHLFRILADDRKPAAVLHPREVVFVHPHDYGDSQRRPASKSPFEADCSSETKRLDGEKHLVSRARGRENDIPSPPVVSSSRGLMKCNTSNQPNPSNVVTSAASPDSVVVVAATDEESPAIVNSGAIECLVNRVSSPILSSGKEKMSRVVSDANSLVGGGTGSSRNGRIPSSSGSSFVDTPSKVNVQTDTKAKKSAVVETRGSLVAPDGIDLEEEGVDFDPVNDPSTRSVVNSLVAVGSRVSVYWPEDNRFYKGTISDFRTRGEPFYLEYDDGEEEWIDLRNHRFRFLLKKTSPRKEGSVDVRSSSRIRHASVGASDARSVSGKRVSIGSSKSIPTPLARERAIKENRVQNVKPRNEEKVALETPVHMNRKRGAVENPLDGESKANFVDVDNRHESINPFELSSDVKKIKVGSRVSVWWEGDKTFYSGFITKRRDHKKAFWLEYDDGLAQEWVDFSSQKFLLLPDAPPERKKRGRRKKDDRLCPEQDIKSIHVGSRVSVWWTTVAKYYAGTVVRQRSDERPFFIEYDHGGSGHWIDFARHTFRLLDKDCSASLTLPTEKEEDVAESGLEGDASGPSDIDLDITVGTRVAVYWEGDGKYYKGIVKKEKKNRKKPFYVEYEDGEAAHWIDFKEHWVRVLSDKPLKSKRESNAIVSRAKRKCTDGSLNESRTKKRRRRPKSHNFTQIEVGARVELWWSGDSRYYRGTVSRSGNKPSKFYVEYDDGDKEWVNFAQQTFRVLNESEEDAIPGEDTLSNATKSGNEENATSEDSSDEEDHLAYDDFVYGVVDGVAVGSRLSVWWPSEKRYFDGTLKRIDDSRKPYFIRYDDGDEEWTDLRRRYFRFID